MLAERVNTAVRRVPVWLVYVLGLLPAPWFLYLGLTGGLGVEPIKALEHELGLFALQLLVAGLAITPLRRFAGVNLIRFRRAVGVLAFTYVALHLLVWLVLDVQVLSRIWADILKRPYISIGMIGFLLMVPLALTSNNWSVRRLGPRWRQVAQADLYRGASGGRAFRDAAQGVPDRTAGLSGGDPASAGAAPAVRGHDPPPDPRLSGDPALCRAVTRSMNRSGTRQSTLNRAQDHGSS